jgi:hypothetical protein
MLFWGGCSIVCNPFSLKISQIFSSPLAGEEAVLEARPRLEYRPGTTHGAFSLKPLMTLGVLP